MPHPPSTPPELVRAFRRRFGLTHTALAELLGVPPRTIIRYEHTEGPGWLGYAFAGIAGTVFNASATEVRALACLARGEGAVESVSMTEPPHR